MIYGVGAPRFIYTDIDFTETGFYRMTKKEVDSSDITRPSQITDENKHFEVGSYLEHTFIFYNKSKANIDLYKTMLGKVIQFFPHADVGTSYSAVVLEVKSEMRNNLASQYTLTITVRSRNYFKFGTRITVASPNGSETYARNQVVNITWTSNNVTGNAQIELWKDGSYLSTIIAHDAVSPVLLSAGTYAWTVAADAVIDTDYQIKVANSTGYIYDISNAVFNIVNDGFVRIDGSNDYAITKAIPTASKTRTFAWFYRSSAFANGIVFASYTDANNFERVEHYNNTIRYLKHVAGVQKYHLSSDAPTTDGAWHSIVMTIDLNVADQTDRVNLWYDGVSASMSGSYTMDQIPFTGVNPYSLFAINSVIGYTEFLPAQDIKHMIYSETVWDQTKITAYHALNITAANTAMWLRCNDADAGTPWTDNMLDSSGNAKHATPVNITGATFFNQT
jgi:hypothetical protein